MVGYRVVTYQLWEKVGKITFFNPGKIDVYEAVLFWSFLASGVPIKS